MCFFVTRCTSVCQLQFGPMNNTPLYFDLVKSIFKLLILSFLDVSFEGPKCLLIVSALQYQLQKTRFLAVLFAFW